MEIWWGSGVTLPSNLIFHALDSNPSVNSFKLNSLPLTNKIVWFINFVLVFDSSINPWSTHSSMTIVIEPHVGYYTPCVGSIGIGHDHYVLSCFKISILRLVMHLVEQAWCEYRLIYKTTHQHYYHASPRPTQPTCLQICHN